MAWSSVIVTDTDGANVGEVSNPYERTYSWRANGITAQRFSLRLDDPLAKRLLDADIVVKSYNDEWPGVLPAVLGEVTDYEETVGPEGKRLAVTIADPTWRFAQRLIGKSKDGYKKTVATDRGAVMHELLAAVNAQNDTGVRPGLLEASASDLIGPWYYKPLSEVQTELSSVLDGFDWLFTPQEPASDATGLALGTLDIYAARGQLRPDAVFSYSNELEEEQTERGNVKTYKRVGSKQGMLNTGYALPPGFPDAIAPDIGGAPAKVQTWSDAASQARWHWREGVVPNDLAVGALRLKLLQENVIVRKEPRQTITIDGVLADSSDGPAVPRFKLDFDIGDVVPFRAVVDGEVHFNGSVRVWGVDLSIDDQGFETPTLIVTPDGVS